MSGALSFSLSFSFPLCFAFLFLSCSSSLLPLSFSLSFVFFSAFDFLITLFFYLSPFFSTLLFLPPCLEISFYFFCTFSSLALFFFCRDSCTHLPKYMFGNKPQAAPWVGLGSSCKLIIPPPLLPSLSFPSFFLSFPSPLPSPPFPFLLPLAFYIASFRCLRLRLFAIFIYHSLFFPFPFHSFAYFSLWSGHANGLSIPTFPYDFFSHRTVLRIARPNTQEHTRIDTSGGSCEQGRGRVFSWPISTHQNRDDAQIKFASQCP